METVSVSPTVVLAINRLSKQYGTVRALDNVNLSVARGEIKALLGQNGAGKSTLVRIVAGAESPTEGTLTLGDEEFSASDPDTAKKHGIAYVSQEGNLNPEFTVPENVFLGREKTRFKLLDRRAMQARVAELLQDFQLDLALDRPVADLDPSKRKLAEIVRALASRPRLLILDEPTAALPAPDVQHLLAIVRTLAASGMAVLFISHYLDEVFDVSTSATVLRDGRVTWDGPIDQTDADGLIHAMVGREVGAITPSDLSESTAPPVLQVRDLATRDARVCGASLSASPGRIRGIFGVVGAGKSELLEAVFGIRAVAAGSMEVNGTTLRRWNSAVAIGNGMALVPEDRNEKALLGEFSIAWNVAMPHWKRLARRMNIGKRESKLGREVIRELDIKAPGPQTLVRDLSGGNKQKVSIGRWLGSHATARIFLFDEPTQGLDVGARSEVYRLMRTLADGGAAVVVASSDVEEIVTISDDITAIRNGITVDLAADTPRTAAAVLSAAA
jgi:ABC-type sugar transport system ATPase subunit